GRRRVVVSFMGFSEQLAQWGWGVNTMKHEPTVKSRIAVLTQNRSWSAYEGENPFRG
ncbi:MAG: hypothetical protein ACJATT_005351, partial [Myxococcota bacterium]